MPETPEHSKFKKGQSGNPNGRPKGSRNRATLVREWLEVTQNIKNPLTGEVEPLQQQDLIILALIKRARNGDVNAAKELLDSAHGKLKDQSVIEHITDIRDKTDRDLEEELRQLESELNEPSANNKTRNSKGKEAAKG